MGTGSADVLCLAAKFLATRTPTGCQAGTSWGFGVWPMGMCTTVVSG